MDFTLEPIARLASNLGKLPGIGAKTALRLSYFIVNMEKNDVSALAEAMICAKESIKHCSICGNLSCENICNICQNKQRTDEIICVVKDPRDIIALEKARNFNGKYHVLHGTISPMDGIGPQDIKINELLERIKEGKTKEVILATNPDIEGEATATYIASLIKPFVNVTRIAHGVPIGGNLEYVDEITLSKALEGRRSI